MATRSLSKPKIVVKRSMPQTLVMVVSTGNVGVGPMAGNGMNRQFTHTELGATGDGKLGQIIGEYTCEVRLQKTHAMITNTAVS